QGALAIETRNHGAGLKACTPLDHAPTRAAVSAERGVLAALGGGCQVPLGAHAGVEGDHVFVSGVVISPDGAHVVRGEANGPAAEAERTGRELGRRLLDRGGRPILEAVHAVPPRNSKI
ncbi:MAG: hydroxymethylbilane synthase, partial [Acidobacteria bacterium]|nr:hydroxymethylbilane synthase [Acidobacteriota bacterium]